MADSSRRRLSMTSSPRMSLFRAALLAGALFACLVPGARPRTGPASAVTPAARARSRWTRARRRSSPSGSTTTARSGPRWSSAAARRAARDVRHGRRRRAPAAARGRRVRSASADVGDDADVFGTPSGVPATTAPTSRSRTRRARRRSASCSSPTTMAANIQIAQFDEADGNLVERRSTVPGTTGMTIASSLLAPAAPRRRPVLRRGRAGCSRCRWRTRRARRVVRHGDEHRRRQRQPDREPGARLEPRCARHADRRTSRSGPSDGFLRTYRASRPRAGSVHRPQGRPRRSRHRGGRRDDAERPGSARPARSPTRRRSSTSPPPACSRSSRPVVDDTIAYKLHVVDGAFEFNFEFLPIPDTDPAPALAVSQLASGADPEDIPDGEVLIPTATNLFLVDHPRHGPHRRDRLRERPRGGQRRLPPDHAVDLGPALLRHQRSRASRSSAVSATARRCRRPSSRATPANAGADSVGSRPAGGLARLRRVRRPGRRVRLPQPDATAAGGRADRARRRIDRLRRRDRRRDSERRARGRSRSRSAPTAARSAPT